MLTDKLIPNKKQIGAMAFAVVSLVQTLAFAGQGAGSFTWDETGDIVPGKWNSQYAKAIAYANEHDCPIVGFWANPGCAYCNELEEALGGNAAFANWAAERGYVLLFGYGYSGDSYQTMSFCSDASGQFPYVCLGWNGREIGTSSGSVHAKGTIGTDYRLTFSGRDSYMPGAGSDLATKFMNSCDMYLQAYSHDRWLYEISEGQVVLLGVKYKERLSGKLSIPATITNLPVTVISAEAFADCSQFSAVEIPSSVTNIGARAFARCSGLTRMTIPRGVVSMGSASFEDCSSLKVIDFEGLPPDGLADAGLPSDIIVRYNAAHSGAWQSVVASCGFTDARATDLDAMSVLPDGYGYTETINGYTWTFAVRGGVAVIGTRDDSGDDPYLRAISPAPTGTVVVPDTLGGCPVGKIDAAAFKDCSAFTDVTIPDSVTNIVYDAFENCSGLGEGVVVAGGCLLYINGMCPAHVVVPADVRLIADDAFVNIAAVEQIDFQGPPPLGLATARLWEDVPLRYNATYAEAWTAALAAAGFTNVSAYSPIVGVEWSYYQWWGDRVVITGARWDDAAQSGVLTLPEELDGYIVAGIGEEAFKDCTAITGVEIPSAVVYIGANAFAGCTGLGEGVIVADGCVLGAVNGSCPANVVLPSDARVIADSAFAGCDTLTGVTIPAGVTSIGENAFAACRALASIDVDAENENYASVDGALYNVYLEELICCPAGKSGNFVVSADVTCIDSKAFYGCARLTGVTLPQNLDSIGDMVFSGCTRLTQIDFPVSLSYIGEGVFDGCRLLTAINVADGNAYFASVDGVFYSREESELYEIICCPAGKSGELVLPEGLKYLNDAFRGCTKLTRVVLPASLECNEMCQCGVFATCRALTAIDVQEGNVLHTSVDGVLYYKDEETGDPSGLVCCPPGKSGELVIPEGVNWLGYMPFGGCTLLTKITLPSTVEYFDNPEYGNYFSPCSALTAIDVAADNESYVSIDGVLYSKNLDAVVCCPPGKSGDVVIPEGARYVQGSAFYNCSNVTHVTFPASLTELYWQSFYGCAALTYVTIPMSVTYIEEDAFGACPALTQIDFEGMPPDGLGCAGLPDDIQLRYNAKYAADWADILGEMETGFANAASYVVAPAVVTFNANGGVSVEATREVERGEEVGELPEPVWEGHEFIGWFTTLDVQSEYYAQIESCTTVQGDITWYARWKPLLFANVSAKIAPNWSRYAEIEFDIRDLPDVDYTNNEFWVYYGSEDCWYRVPAKLLSGDAALTTGHHVLKIDLKGLKDLNCVDFDEMDFKLSVVSFEESCVEIEAEDGWEWLKGSTYRCDTYGDLRTTFYGSGKLSFHWQGTFKNSYCCYGFESEEDVGWLDQESDKIISVFGEDWNDHCFLWHFNNWYEGENADYLQISDIKFLRGVPLSEESVQIARGWPELELWAEQQEDGRIALMTYEDELVKIYYTTNGTLPTKESSVYAEPFAWEDFKNIQAVALSNEGAWSLLLSGSDYARISLDPVFGSVSPDFAIWRISSCEECPCDFPAAERDNCEFLGWTRSIYDLNEGWNSIENEPITADDFADGNELTLYAMWDVPIDQVIDPDETLGYVDWWMEYSVERTAHSYVADGEIHRCVYEYVNFGMDAEPYSTNTALSIELSGAGTLTFETLSDSMKCFVDNQEKVIRSMLDYNTGITTYEVKITEAGEHLVDLSRVASGSSSWCDECEDSVWVYGSVGGIRWVPAPEFVSVTFHAQGGTLGQSQIITYNVGSPYGPLPTPEHDSKYTFVGWFTDPLYGEQKVPGDMVDFEVEALYARWSTSLATALNNENLTFASTGDAAWIGQSRWSHDGDSAAMAEFDAWNATNVLETTVSGCGVLSFRWKVTQDSVMAYGGIHPVLVLAVDGKSYSMNNAFADSAVSNDWCHFTLTLTNDAAHSICWRTSLEHSWVHEYWYDSLSDYYAQIIGGASMAVDRPGLWLDEVTWQPQTEQTDVVAWGYSALQAERNLPGLSDAMLAACGQRIAENPFDYEARVRRALTRIKALSENPQFGVILARYGLGLADDWLALTGALDLPNAPLSNDTVDAVAAETLPTLAKILEDVDVIPQDWADTVALSAEDYPVDEDVYVDAADVVMLRALAHGAIAAIRLAQGYDLALENAHLQNELNAYTNRETYAVQQYLGTLEGLPECRFAVSNRFMSCSMAADGTTLYARFAAVEGLPDVCAEAREHCLELQLKTESDLLWGDVSIAYSNGVAKVGGYAMGYDLPNNYIYITEKIVPATLQEDAGCIVLVCDLSSIGFSDSYVGWTLDTCDMAWFTEGAGEAFRVHFRPHKAYEKSLSVAYLLADHPSCAARIRDAAALTESKASCRTALGLYGDYARLVKARTCDVLHFVEYDAKYETEWNALVDAVKKAESALDDVVTLKGEDYACFKHFSSKYTNVIERATLKPLFEGRILRNLLPPFVENAPVLERIPDITFAGTFPDWTMENRAYWLAQIPSVTSTMLSNSVFDVTFDLNGHAQRSGGGELHQTIPFGMAAIAPELAVDAGWSFAGWDRSFDTVMEALVITAQYTRNRYAVNINGVSQGEHAYGDSITAVVPQENISGLTNLVCVGWVGTGDVPLTGVGTQVTFTVTQDSSLSWLYATNYWFEASSDEGGEIAILDGGFAADPKGCWVPTGTNVIVGVSGDTAMFLGWWNMLTGEKIPNASYIQYETKILEPHSVQARFSVRSTTQLAFDANGGTGGVRDAITASYDRSMPSLSAYAKPERIGYVFTGYYDRTTGGEQYYDSALQSVRRWNSEAANATLYAQWRPIAYSIRFDANGGTGVMNPLSGLSYGGWRKLPTCTFSHATLNFWGWSLDGGSEAAYADEASVSNLATNDGAIVTLYAVWRTAPKTFTFEATEAFAEKGGFFVLTVNGGSEDHVASVKVAVTYNSAKASDLDLKNATVSGLDGRTEQTSLKFPLTLTWTKGDVTPKVIKIPVAAGKATDAAKYLTWNLSGAIGLDLGDAACCIGTIARGNSAADAAFVLPCVADAAGGKVSGGATPKKDSSGAYKPVTLKATASKGYWFAGWYKGGEFVSNSTSFKVTPESDDDVSVYEARFVATPTWAVGTFNGRLDSGFGSATLTVSSAGKFSGKVITGGKTWSFSATGCEVVEADDGSTILRVAATAKNSKLTAEVALEISESGVYGSIVGESIEESITLWRDAWKDTGATAKISPFAGLYTVQLEGSDSGFGYLSLKIDAKGKCKATGKLPDGTSAAATLPLVWEGDAPFAIWQVAPSAYKGGCVGGFLYWDSDKGVAGSGIVWISKAPAASAEYGEGFSRTMSARGAWYDKSVALSQYYERLTFSASAPLLDATVKYTEYVEDDNGNARKATSSEAVQVEAQSLTCWDNLTLSLNAAGTSFVVDAGKATKPVKSAGCTECGEATDVWAYEGLNDAALAFSFAKATGIFKGSFVCWYDYASAVDYIKETTKWTHTSKKVSYEGIMVLGDGLRGLYLWERVGNYQDAKTGKDKTYKYKESCPVFFE